MRISERLTVRRLAFLKAGADAGAAPGPVKFDLLFAAFVKCGLEGVAELREGCEQGVKFPAEGPAGKPGTVFQRDLLVRDVVQELQQFRCFVGVKVGAARFGAATVSPSTCPVKDAPTLRMAGFAEVRCGGVRRADARG